jgi:hypothetical protein
VPEPVFRSHQDPESWLYHCGDGPAFLGPAGHRELKVLVDLRDALASTLDRGLVGLYVHGSLIAGDFAADRSDLDLLAVLPEDPDERLLDVLTGLHTELDRRHPSWASRIEVEYVSTAAFTHPSGHVIARVSPGEPLHLLAATTHRVVTWASVHDSGRCLLGPPAATLIPDYDPELVRSALLDHVRDWPAWVTGMTGAPGGQAYAVLTMCRALQRLRYGRQLSKRQTADLTIGVLPEWAGLIEWARNWWYAGGRQTDVGHPDEVHDFVVRLSATLSA